jgi:hypothetical protein
MVRVMELALQYNNTRLAHGWSDGVISAIQYYKVSPYTVPKAFLM